MDICFSKCEVSRAINFLKNNKSPGFYGLPTNFYKVLKGILFSPLLKAKKKQWTIRLSPST
eukprot:c38742_g1_i1 orf=507-689(+)